MARKLHIAIKDKVATYSQRDGFIVCGNSDYVIEFTFDGEWDGYNTKTARFISNGSYEDVVFTGNTVAVPVMRNTTSVSVGVFSGDLKTSTPAVIPCEKSILCSNGTPSAPTESVYNQIIELLNKNVGMGGNDGISPTITVTAISGGHRITITDANGTQYFDVMDGEDSSGSGTSVVIGAQKPTSACLWFNTYEYDTKYSVTYNLTNCISREGGEDCEVLEGNQYQDEICAADGHTIESISVTMGGQAVSVVDGVFYISSVTGDVVITATAIPEGAHKVTYYLNGASSQNGGVDTYVVSGGQFQDTIYADDGLIMHGVVVTMGNKDISLEVLDKDSGGISIDSVDNDVCIFALGITDDVGETMFSYSEDCIGCQSNADELVGEGTLSARRSLYLRFTPNSGYKMQSLSVTMGGKAVGTAVYDSVASFQTYIVGDINVVAVAVAE